VWIPQHLLLGEEWQIRRLADAILKVIAAAPTLRSPS
jgi:hypothetical protein